MSNVNASAPPAAPQASREPANAERPDAPKSGRRNAESLRGTRDVARLLAEADESRQAGAFEDLLRLKADAVQLQGLPPPPPLVSAPSTTEDANSRRAAVSAVEAPPLPQGLPQPHPQAPLVAAEPQPVPRAGTTEFTPSATLEKAMRVARLEEPLPVSPVQAVHESASRNSWEVTLTSPAGAPMQMQATRAVDPAALGQAPWSLTLTTPARESALMNRHATRLADRLRAREVGVDSLQVRSRAEIDAEGETDGAAF